MLSNLQELLERSVYHALRKTVVDEGYIPNIDNFDVENADPALAKAAIISYKNAIDLIVQEKGFAIELFNYAPSQQRGNMKVPRIVLDTQAFYQGELGIDSLPTYELNDQGSYDKKSSGNLVSDFNFNIRLISNTTEQTRILHAIMVKTLPRRGYLPIYNVGFKSSNNLFIRYLSHADFTWTDEGIIEKVYRYVIPDVNEFTEEVIAQVPKLTEIDTNINIENTLITIIMAQTQEIVDLIEELLQSNNRSRISALRTVLLTILQSIEDGDIGGVPQGGNPNFPYININGSLIKKTGTNVSDNEIEVGDISVFKDFTVAEGYLITLMGHTFTGGDSENPDNWELQRQITS